MRLTLANATTLFRLLLLFPALYFLMNGQRWLALGFLFAVLVGDLLDGAIARIRHEETPLGKVLDPAVDKIVFVSVLGMLVWIGDLSWLSLAALVILQLVVIVGAILWFRDQKSPPASRPLGKAASFLLSVGILMTILEMSYGQWVVYGSLLAMYAAGLDYLVNLIRVLARSASQSFPKKAQIQAEEGRPAPKAHSSADGSA